MPDEDLDAAMEVAAIAGQMHVVSEVVAGLQMPVISAFLEAKGEELHDIAVNLIYRFGATRALSAAVKASGVSVGALGENEMAEGLARLVVAEELATRSDEMAVAGAVLTAEGLVEVAEAEAMHEAARELEAEGVVEMGAGMSELGRAAGWADEEDAAP